MKIKIHKKRKEIFECGFCGSKNVATFERATNYIDDEHIYRECEHICLDCMASCKSEETWKRLTKEHIEKIRQQIKGGAINES